MIRSTLVVACSVVAALVFSGCSGGRSTAEIEPTPDVELGVEPSAEEQTVDSAALITAAADEGRIDYSTSLLYKVYALFEPDSLPAEFRSNVPMKCATPLIMEVQRNWDRIDADDRSEISMYIQPLTPAEGAEELQDVTKDRADFAPNREQ
jgi:hypothetical protein